MRNQDIIRKAEMSLSALKSGGLMNPAQASAFIRMVQNTPTIFSESRVIQMENDSQKFEKIGFGQRILRAAEEGKALTDDQLTVPATSTVQLNTKEVIAEINITYDTLENNIEKDGLQQTIMQILAERAAVDIEELVVNGDTSSSDPYLAQLDGIRKQTVSHVIDGNGEELSRATFKKGLKAIPAKYLRLPQEFRFYTSQGMEIEWKDRVADRQTNLGDLAVQGGLSSAFGVPVKGVSNLQPYSVGEGDSQYDTSDIILTHPKISFSVFHGISESK